ncbi:unnamed protein product [Cladocopium goreaui]|uniref:Pentatricopeptide repeat-containing protein, chloroplastic n=1 Tax=Cladocopium goreaui TaxID=2562237 RepID=A0A9P1GR82_9DINO|nr:unnamed protein product [Cladocopium goreaui]
MRVPPANVSHRAGVSSVMARFGHRPNRSRRSNVRRWQHGKRWSWTNRAPGWSEGEQPGPPIEVWKGTTNWAKEAQDCGWTFALPGESWLKDFPGLLKHEDEAQESGSTSTLPEEPWLKNFPGLLKHEDEEQTTATACDHSWWRKEKPLCQAQESGSTSTLPEERPWLEDLPLKYEDEAPNHSDRTVEEPVIPVKLDSCPTMLAPAAKEALDSAQMAAAPVPPKAAIPAGWAWHFLQEVQEALRTEGVSNFENFTPEDTEQFLTRWKDRLNLGDISQLRNGCNGVDSVHSVHTAPWQLVPCPEKRGAKRQHSSDHLPDAKRARPMIAQVMAQPQQQEVCFREQVCYQILEVDEVFFSQRKMSRRFKDGRYVEELLDDLWQGRAHPLDEFLHLDVVERPYSGKYRLFSNHNRRLWCLKQHKLNLGGEEVYVRCKIVPKETLRQVRTNQRHFDTRNGGQSIKLRD